MNDILIRYCAVLVLILGGCGDSDSDSDDGNSSADVGSKNVSVTGTLAVDDNVSDKKSNANVEVEVQDLNGNVVGTTRTDDSGNYAVPVPGSLVVDSTSAALVSGNFKLRGGFTDSSSGKAYGLDESLSIKSNELTSSDGGKTSFDVGSKVASEISGITATIKFADTAEVADGAEVYIPGKSFFAKLGETGKVEILYVPAGTYTLRIEKGFYKKSVSVTVEENKTSALGDVTVALTDRRPAPLSSLLIGTWASTCYGSSTSTTDTVTVNSTTSVSFGKSTPSSLWTTGTGCGPASNTVTSFEIVSETYIKVTTDDGFGNAGSANIFVLSASKDKITFASGSIVEVWTRSS